ncbi:MAG: choice-of-anchor V domain-containing protein [Longimicrobiales bacterium]
MTAARHVALSTLVVALAAASGLAARSAPHPDAPPPAHTGGFGEPTCHECHFQRDINAGKGSLTLTGLRADIASGTTHRLTITLTHPGQSRAGFMLSARTADGAQAGTLRAVDATTTVTLAGDVAYLHHTLAGTAVTGDTAAWTLEWIANDLAAGDSVVFHLVGNAANDDASPFGDYVYAASRSLTVR